MAKFDNQGSHSHITTGDQDSLLVVNVEENDSLIMKLGNQSAPQEEISKLPIGWELQMAPVNVVDSSELAYATKFGLPSTSHLQVKILKKPELTNDERLALYHYLLEQSNGGKLKRGLIQAAAKKYSISRHTVSRIWHQAKENLENEGGAYNFPNINSKKKGRVGAKKVNLNLSRISGIPLRRRTNIRSLACALDVSKTTLHARIKEGLIRSHSNAVKPRLTLENQKARLEFCISMLNPMSLACEMPSFQDMYNFVHIDEKWFFMSKVSQKYYLLPEEDDPHRVCQNKRFIPKVMFLAAVARPRFDTVGNVLFDGKIGIFPFVSYKPAKRSSKNRSAGTIETHPMISVTKQVTKEYLIEKVLPAIRSKWPHGEKGEIIFIQQDNAKPHISPEDPDFLEAASKDGFEIRLICQPPNSPDLNILDLGFFRCIQTLQHQQAPKSIDELLTAVQQAFQDFPTSKLNQIFLTQQQCMVKIMKVGGRNNYKLQHLGKGKLKHQGSLPEHLLVDSEIVHKAMEVLLGHANDLPQAIDVEDSEQSKGVLMQPLLVIMKLPLM